MSITPPAAAKQPIDWKKVDDAIYDWIGGKLGYTVIWENQNVEQPAYPYVSLLRTSLAEEGGPKETRHSFISGQPAGQEIQLLTYEPVKFTLAVSVHVDRAQGANDPSSNAMDIASKIRGSLGQESTIEQLLAEGLSVVGEEGIQDTSVVVNGVWISRATMDVIFRTASVMTERTGYADKVGLESTALGVDTIVDAS
jgi:hypothetical protein